MFLKIYLLFLLCTLSEIYVHWITCLSLSKASLSEFMVVLHRSVKVKVKGKVVPVL
jgi:hypothetical protein